MWQAKEQELVDHVGIDAALYVRFMRMCRNMFLIFTVIGCGVVIPINVIYNLKSPLAENASKSDAFFLMTPTLIYGNPFYAHVAVTWVFDLVICYFLWVNFNKVIELRRNKFMTEEYQNALYMRSLMVTEIPKKYKSDEGLIALMGKLKVSRPIQNASAGRDVKVLSNLISKHEATVQRLESVLAKYLKYPEKLPAQRPVCKPFKDDRGRNSGYGNGKTDEIDYLCGRMERLEREIEEARNMIDNNKTLPYGFVSYESVEDSHTVAKSTRRKRRGKLNCTLAPRPQDIIWNNIVLTRFERGSKQKWGNFLFICLLIGWIIPNAFMGTFLSQLSRIGALWKPFNVFINNYPVLFSIVQGVISPMITSLIFLILPALMRRMAQSQGKVTKHEREVDVTKKLYTFFVFNNLVVFTIFSVAWSGIATVITLIRSGQNLSFQIVIDRLDLPHQLAQAILGVSSFWVMYILRVNLGAVLDLLQLVSLLWRGFQRNVMSPTPRELMMWSGPQHFNFAAYYNWLLFYTTIALCFAMVQPLVLPVIALYFSLDSIYKKYSLMYIFVTKAESDGLFWPFLFNSFLFATGLGNVVLFAVVWVQGGWRIAVILAPLLPLLIIFKLCSRRAHNDRFYYFIPTPEEQEKMMAIRTRTNLSDISHHALARRYRNPAITKKLMVPMVHAKAQHILPEICNISHYNRDEADLETAFVGMDESFDHKFGKGPEYSELMVTSDDKGGITKVRNSVGGGGGLKFDIVEETDMTYEHYKEIEQARIATPFNPSLTNVNASSHSLGGDNRTIPIPPVPEVPREYQRQHSNNSSDTAVSDSGLGVPERSVHYMTSRDSLVHHTQPVPRTDYFDDDETHSLPDSYYRGVNYHNPYTNGSVNIGTPSGLGGGSLEASSHESTTRQQQAQVPPPMNRNQDNPYLTDPSYNPYTQR